MLTRVFTFRRVFIAIAAVFCMSVLQVPFASAGIVKIQQSQTCNVIGLDPSPDAAQGGVHCDVGNNPFSLSAVLNGTISLFIGNSQTPSWNLVNDTGKLLSSLTLFYTGALATNSLIDMQISGTNIFQACTATTATGVVTSDANCGSGDVTALDPALPLKMVWSGGTGVAADGVFNVGTASFAHAGADTGCISGKPTSCQTVPEPVSLSLISLGLLGVAGVRRWLLIRGR